ncbi:MAG TPA: ABC transporter ATP-binding protein [Planctomycetaceae bacterium]|nr:ABC transporter ATP-binding protein [Planctomycetaceae bacterium]
MTGLEVSHLEKRYGDVIAVDDLSFHVDHGEIFGLIGPNGAGKSTTMLIIIGLLKSDAGSVLFDGQRYNPRNADMRASLGIVPQDVAVYPELTALQNLRFFARLQGLAGRREQERIDYVLQLTGLAPNADRPAATFSGGMLRRLNFGIALLHEPRFVVLDEPTVGIDPQSRSNLLDAVRDLSRQGVGVLYASHYIEEVEAVCHRVAIIDRGRLLRQGTLEELQTRTEFNVTVRVAAMPAELVRQLGTDVELRSEQDGTTSIMVRESLELQRVGRSSRLRGVLELLERARIPLQGIQSQEANLETLFLNLTGRTMRD